MYFTKLKTGFKKNYETVFRQISSCQQGEQIVLLTG